MFQIFFQLGMQMDDIHLSFRDDCVFVYINFMNKFYTNFVISKIW
jgi:hypothetical protein